MTRQVELLSKLEETGGRDNLGQEMNLNPENPFQGSRQLHHSGALQRV